MREIGINLPETGAVDFIRTAHELGFNTIFSGVPSEAELFRIENTLAACGMRHETIHAPFDHINDIWLAGEAGEATLRDLLCAVERCAQGGVPVAVVHLSSGKTPPPVTEIGRARYERLVDYAAQKGIRIAFENQRQLENVSWAFRHFADAAHVGFCFDCGHECCFTPGIEFMPLFGHKLLCTHIHDNDCMPDHDLHMIPFDGKVDFGRVVRRLRESGYQGPLTLEIHRTNSHRYDFMTQRAFLERAVNGVRRVRTMLDGFQ